MTIDLESSVKTLRAKRAELVKQLEAIDTALAALATLGTTAVDDAEPPREPDAEAMGSVVPRRIKPRRMLSDDHRQALLDGRRVARHTRAVDQGFARELIDPSPAPSKAAALPRLVKHVK